jgi:hypothetical protein
MSATTFTFAFDVTRKCALGLRLGDTIILDPEAEDPIVLYRPLRVPRSSVDALIESGALKFVEGQSWTAEDCHKLLDFLHPGLLRPFREIVEGPLPLSDPRPRPQLVP